MTSTAPQNQNRCVFVGNIPYDATEEQLIQICEEVGPVVSFRLVLDKESGKPKGYGFCEYKDEETALSARRNLQGYEINGRQLRVDFAENGKNADRNRDQGRGGPGVGPNLGTAQHPSGAIPVDLAASQPLGLSATLSAMSALAGALGGTQNGLANQQGPDQITNYLARMSRHQLLGILSEYKLLAAQNNQMVRQFLQRNPNLPRALFQAEIMLGLVTPQMMQMASNQRHPSHLANQMHQQHVSAIPMQPRPPPGNPILVTPNPIPVVQVPVPHQQVPVPRQQVPITTLGGPSMLQPVQTHANLAASGGLVPQLQSTVLQQTSRPPFGLANVVHQPAPPAPSISMPQKQMAQPASQIVLPTGQQLTARAETVQSEMKPWSDLTRPSKIRRLDATKNTNGVSAVNTPLPQAASQMSNSTAMQTGKLTQQLTPEAQSALLQQVLSLTPEQLSSLPIEEQQQVLQLQKVLSSNSR